MCFSAEASFAGGIIISLIGVATIRKVHKSSQILFACIPFFFGIQQIVEGFLWITLPMPDYISTQKFFTYFFLIMADFLWPVMIPLSVLLMEENKNKTRLLWVLLVMGFLLSLYYAYCLIFLNVFPQIKGYHILYKTDFPKSVTLFAFAIYLIVTITPLFISSIKRTKLLGIFMFLSCLVSAVFYIQYITSVWCFFAALISVVIFWILKDSKEKLNFDKLNLLRVRLVQPKNK